MEGSHVYRFPMVSVATDLVLLNLPPAGGVRVALVRRDPASEAFPGAWALPGGFLRAAADPDLEACARRELLEEVGVEAPHLELVGVYSGIGRDPRPERVISVAYLAPIRAEDPAASPIPGTDVSEARWVPLLEVADGTYEGMPLAFDHARILTDARQLLATRVPYGRKEERAPELLFALLPDAFTLSHAAELMTHLKGERTDPSNLRKYLLPFLEPTGAEARTSTRSAALYRRRQASALASQPAYRTAETPPFEADFPPDTSIARNPDEGVDTMALLSALQRRGEETRIRHFDLFVATLVRAKPDDISLIDRVLDTYLDAPEQKISVTRIPELRISDTATGRALVALHFDQKRGLFLGTALARPDRLEGAGGTEVTPHKRDALSSRFTLAGGGEGFDLLARIIDLSREELVTRPEDIQRER